MNRLQEKEFSLLKCFVEICEKMDLQYFLVCGSALGAAKYRGFIPWDDDLDVGLYRHDYERFLKEAPALLPDGIFLQTFRSDRRYPNIFAKLRDSNTTYIEKAVAGIPMHHGIYIDVFPLDGYPREEAAQKRLEKKKLRYKRLLSSVYQVERSMKGRVAVALMRLVGIHRHTARYLQRYEQMISSYKVEESELICNHGNWQGSLEYAPRWHYGGGTWAMFEGLCVRVPEQLDPYLTQKYGDWRAELPLEEQVGHHYYSVFDSERSYADYM